MTGPFIKWAMDYKARGFSPLPVNPGSKVPSFGGKYKLTGWSVYCESPADDWQIKSWGRSCDGLGIILACGYGGMVAIDVDDPRVYGAVKQVFGHIKAPAKVGRRGATAFFYDPTGLISNRNFRAANEDGTIGGTLVEILVKGRQTVIPPTIHKDTGRPYRWHNGDLETCRPHDLPVITQAMIDEVERLIEPFAYKSKASDVKFETADRDALSGERNLKRYRAWADRAYDAEIEKLERAGRGSRGEQLFRAACTLGRYVHNRIDGQEILSLEDVITGLKTACETNGLIDDNGEKDVMKSISNGLSKAKNDELPKLEERAYHG